MPVDKCAIPPAQTNTVDVIDVWPSQVRSDIEALNVRVDQAAQYQAAKKFTLRELRHQAFNKQNTKVDEVSGSLWWTNLIR